MAMYNKGARVELLVHGYFMADMGDVGTIVGEEDDNSVCVLFDANRHNQPDDWEGWTVTDKELIRTRVLPYANIKLIA